MWSLADMAVFVPVIMVGPRRNQDSDEHYHAAKKDL